MTVESISPIKILAVDDLDENLIALDALLRREGVELLSAHSGNEALELLLAHEVAVALVDVQMPEMDGLELAELMRGAERTKHVPIIFLTAGARDQERVFQGYDAGAVDFLFKPIAPQTLLSKVETFVELFRQRELLASQLEREKQMLLERERLYAELQRTLRLNEMFMAVLGHDLRNPVSSVLTTAELLALSSSDPKVQRAATRLRSVSGRMSRMIDDLLDLARARLGDGIPTQPRSMDLAELAHRAVEEFALARPGVPLNLALEGRLRGFWDEDRLAQLLSNLLMNAAIHGERDKPIGLSIQELGEEEVQLTVSNSGVIRSEVLSSLFDPFRSGEETGRARGLGLGLFIVQQIAIAHCGSVNVISDHGQTSFAVRLPRRHPDHDD